MKIDPFVAREWMTARDLIAEWLFEYGAFMQAEATKSAVAILTRLAFHDPPLLICTADELEQRDTAISALKELRVEISRMANKVAEAIANAENRR